MESIIKGMVKNLGSNEKRVRDRAIKSLKKYFSSDKIQFTDLDFAKLWKGLFYSKKKLTKAFLSTHATFLTQQNKKKCYIFILVFVCFLSLK